MLTYHSLTRMHSHIFCQTVTHVNSHTHNTQNHKFLFPHTSTAMHTGQYMYLAQQTRLRK